MKQAKENIAKLVEKYNRLKAQNKIKTYNEAQTRKDFIDPLFEYLGWDIRNTRSDSEVVTEENILGDRADMAFRINGITKFFLEAKPLRADLDIEKYARQSINYSWNKAVNWAVLTDFESIKVFYSQGESRNIRDKMVFELSCDQYISDFDILKLLSKESFAINALDKFAEKIGKKSKSLTVNEKLFSDLRKAREILTEAFGGWSENWKKGFDKVLLDEGVQRILDRLIFIRVLEDRNLEEPILRPLSRAWEDWKIDRSGNKQLFHLLINKFRELDDTYNSNLFIKHACEDWEEYSEAVKKVIDILYGNDIYEYNFKYISADILGGVYESYLGYIAQNPIKVEIKSGKLLQVDSKEEIKIKSRQKRKEHGIYYTPKFIVDYIVQNTLGEKLKEAKGMHDLKQIKILDPACGSGSFLTKALEVFYDKYKDFSYRGDSQSAKSEILMNNIHGVDLDPQAVELAKLNLLIDTLNKKAKLPNLTQNIHNGNSLISGTDEELKKYFGRNFHDKKPFNWKEEFPEIFKQGGFDVIIGNPPYISFYSRESSLDAYKDDIKWLADKYEFTQKYNDRRLNTVMFFVEKALKLLKPGGYLGFIVDANFSEKPFRAIRKLIDDMGVGIKMSEKINEFGDVNSDQIIVILRNDGKTDPIGIIKYDNTNKTFLFTDEKIKRNLFREDTINLKTKGKISFNDIKTKLSDIAEISTGIQIGIGGTRMYQGKNIEELFYSDKKEGENFYENISLKSNDFYRYSPLKIKNFVNLNEELAYKINNSVKKCNIAVQKAREYKNVPKIFIRQSASILTASLGNPEQMSEYSAFMLKVDDLKTLKYILAVINSKLLTAYALQENIILTGNKKQPQIRLAGLKNLPIPTPKKHHKDELVNLTDKILNLNRQIQIIPENSDKWNSIKKEIEKTDKEINQKVYELYGLTEEEIKIVENS